MLATTSALALAAMLAAITPEPASAQTSWTGAHDTNWNDSRNWDAGVPTSRTPITVINTTSRHSTDLDDFAPGTTQALEIGTDKGSSGSLAIVNGGSLASTGMAVGGQGGSGNLLIQGSTLTNSNHVSIGSGAGSVGVATVAGEGATWTVNGSGSVTVGLGGGTGILNVTSGSSADFASSLLIGQRGGTGTLNVQTGGTLTTGGNAQIGHDASHGGGTGIATVAGFGSQWTIGGNLSVVGNNGGPGTLNIIDNGTVAVFGVTSIGSGGTLAGDGMLTGDVTNAGTIAPGNNGIGALTVNGNVAFQPGSIYRVDINPQGQSDSLNVATGTATLNGGTVAVNAAGGTYKPGTRYTILTAASGVTGKFAGLKENLPLLDLTLGYDPNNAFLDVVRNAVPIDHVTNNPNQRNTARVVDQLGPLHTLNDAIVGLPTEAAVRQALHALSGEVHASLPGVLVDDSRYVRSAVLGRLRQAPYAGEAGPLAALGIGGPELAYQSSPQSSPQGAYGADFPVKAAPAAPPRSSGLAFWAQGYGAWGSFEGNGNAATINRSLGGVLVGLDNTVADGWRVGFAAGYSQSKANIGDRASSATVDSGHVALYGGGSFGAWNLRGGAGYSHHQIDTSRSIAFPGFFDHATADYGGGTAQVFGELGYGIGLGPVAVEPFAGLAYVHVKTNDFNETGGVAALTGSGSTEDVGFSTLGMRFATTFALVDGMALTPRASFAWQHAFNDVTPTAVLAFLQSPGFGFGISGVPLARDSALVDAGLDLRVARQVTLGVSYLGQLASSVQDHAVKGQFTWKF